MFVVTVFRWWEKPRDAWSAANYACEVLVVAQTHQVRPSPASRCGSGLAAKPLEKVGTFRFSGIPPIAPLCIIALAN